MVEIKNLEKTAKRIKKAIKSKEKIILYGDSDLDGTTSVIILEDSIKSLGGKITKVYFPNREKEGYGLNRKNHQKYRVANSLLVRAYIVAVGAISTTAMRVIASG